MRAAVVDSRIFLPQLSSWRLALGAVLTEEGIVLPGSGEAFSPPIRVPAWANGLRWELSPVQSVPSWRSVRLLHTMGDSYNGFGSSGASFNLNPLNAGLEAAGVRAGFIRLRVQYHASYPGGLRHGGKFTFTP